METIYEQFHRPGVPGAYFGERPDWFVFYTRTRDSDVLERSNYACLVEEARQMFGDEGIDWAVERFSHWACGWLESILINPRGRAVEWAEEWLRFIERYPIVNDDHLDNMEWEENMEYILSVGWDNLQPWEKREYAYMERAVREAESK